CIHSSRSDSLQFSFRGSRCHPGLHSFPTRRSSDLVQVNAKKYAVDAEIELQAIRTLIEEELHAGFYNIDVDTSTLVDQRPYRLQDRKSTRLNSSHLGISYAVFCLKKKTKKKQSQIS